MSKRSPELLIEDIIESAKKNLDYTEGFSYEDFKSDGLRVDAVIRNFEIIGEAANRLPEIIKDEIPLIDWHKIRGFRNRVAHDYMGINYFIVWQIRQEFLPELIEILSSRRKH
jgi:uncharacterized protein with HEPN domain